MSVLKNKRKESQFEVFHYYYQMRREMTDLLLRDFGYSSDKMDKKLNKMFGDKPYDELSEKEQDQYVKFLSRNYAFDEWFIKDERKVIIDYLREIGRNIFSANSIYPQYEEELVQRRLLQERAIGTCNALSQELQYSIETLPVNINKYTHFAEMIDHEIDLIKGWRKSDNKFKKLVIKQGCI